MTEKNAVGVTKTGTIGAGSLDTGFEKSSAYAMSFGNIANKTTYFQPAEYQEKGSMQSIEELKSIGYEDHRLSTLSEAYTTGLNLSLSPEELKSFSYAGMGAGTAGKAMSPVYLDKVIIDRSRKFAPWGELISRVSNQGMTADYNVINTKGSAFTALEDGAFNDAIDDISRESEQIKFLYSVGRVTGQTQASVPSFILQGLNPGGSGTNTASFGNAISQNATQKETLVRARAIKELEENLIWNGNSGTDATQFDGIIAQQGTVNQKDLAGSADLTWDNIEETALYSYDDSGRPTIAGCDSKTLKDIRGLMYGKYNYIPNMVKGTVGFGIDAKLVMETAVGSIPVVPSQYLSGTTGEKQLFMLDMDHVEMRVLQDMTYQKLGQNNDSEKFFLKIYETLLLKSPKFNAFVDNIK